MNIQDLFNVIDNQNEAKVLTLQGIEHFNNRNLEEALLAFEKSAAISPIAIPNRLYHALCCFSLIDSKVGSKQANIKAPEIQKHTEDIISSLESAINAIKIFKSEFHTF
ncbi:MAG: hypothetical protein OXL96_07730 [Candidatus Poribacteria bacterium]|nr:hypothetical protein [Candidatus Poribacteria bacterium]